MTMTVAQVHLAVTQSGTWVSYGGAARIVLAVVLVAAAGGVAYAGIRLPLPVRPARPGEGARTFMILTWLFAIAVFLCCVISYVQQARRDPLFHAAPPAPLAPATPILLTLTLAL